MRFNNTSMGLTRGKFGMMTAILLLLIAFGWGVAKTVTRPLAIVLKSHIKICEKTTRGWQVVDEVGPRVVSFDANLLELGSGKKISTNFLLNTRTKKGVPFQAKLAKPANVHFNPVTGQMESDMLLEVTIGKKKALVPAQISTETKQGPLGRLAGRRAKGILGINATSVRLVSANKFQPQGETKSLMLVCTEEYTLRPKSSRVRGKKVK